MKHISTEKSYSPKVHDTRHAPLYFFIKAISFVALLSFVLAGLQYLANYTVSLYLEIPNLPSFSFLYGYSLGSSIVWAALLYALFRFTPGYASAANKINFKWVLHWLFTFIIFLMTHAIATTAITTLMENIKTPRMANIGVNSRADYFLFNLGDNIRDATWIAAVSCFIYFIFSYRREMDSQRLKNAELSLHLNQARMDVLTAQLNPHFLFNALHTVSALSHEHPDRANAVIAQLGGILRIALTRNERLFIRFDEEINFVKEYVGIETVRFGDRLHCEWRIEEAANSKEVPPFLLQPLVENAIKYGVNRSEGKTELIITVKSQGEHLIIEVSHHTEFPVSENDTTHGLKIGLKNLSERLDTLYGKDQWLLEQRFGDGDSSTMILIPASPNAS